MFYTVPTLMFSLTTTVVYLFEWSFTYRTITPITHTHFNITIIITIHIIIKNANNIYQ